MLQRTIPYFLVFFTLTSAVYGCGLKRAYEALEIYNYFKAKKILERKVEKHPFGAGYGLAVIYFRNDNPFHNLDSAYKYALNAEESARQRKEKYLSRLAEYNVTPEAATCLRSRIDSAIYEQVKKQNTIRAYRQYLEKHHLASRIRNPLFDGLA